VYGSERPLWEALFGLMPDFGAAKTRMIGIRRNMFGFKEK
jgi:hypothetical protein